MKKEIGLVSLLFLLGFGTFFFGHITGNTILDEISVPDNFVSEYCGDGFCDSVKGGENSIICSIDCGTSLDKDFDYSLNFFDIRFDFDNGVPKPEGHVNFSIYSPYQITDVSDEFGSFEGDLFPYTDITTTNALYTYPKSRIWEYNVSLSPDQVDALFVGPSINRTGFQVSDIYNLQKELIAENPGLYDFDMTFGADMVRQADGTVSIIQTEDIEEYNEGRTIVLPRTYGNTLEDRGRLYRRYFFNLNNPVVREYLIRYELKALEVSGGDSLYIDNILVQKGLICNEFYSDECPDEVPYIASGKTEKELIDIWTVYLNEIIGEVKSRHKAMTGNDLEVIVNGFSLRQTRPWRVYQMDKFMELGPNFDMILLEGGYWKDDNFYSSGFRERLITDFDYYHDWILRLNDSGVKFLMTAKPDGSLDTQLFKTNNPFIYHLWLWYHLVSEDNTYISFGTHSGFQDPSKDYDVYDYPLGEPLGELHKISNIWYREYERGVVVFDTIRGKLDDIYFVEVKRDDVVVPAPAPDPVVIPAPAPAPVVIPTIDPIDPVIDPIVDPIDPVVIPPVDPSIDPVGDPVVDPIVDPVADPIVDPPKKPHRSSGRHSKNSDEPLDEGNESDVSNSSSGEVGREVVVLQAIKDVMILQGLKDGIFSFETEFASSSGFSSSDGLLFGLLIFFEVLIVAGIVLILMKTDFNGEKLFFLWRKFVK